MFTNCSPNVHQIVTQIVTTFFSSFPTEFSTLSRTRRLKCRKCRVLPSTLTSPSGRPQNANTIEDGDLTPARCRAWVRFFWKGRPDCGRERHLFGRLCVSSWQNAGLFGPPRPDCVRQSNFPPDLPTLSKMMACPPWRTPPLSRMAT